MLYGGEISTLNDIMGKIDLYYNPISIPSRAVQMAAANLGIEVNIKLVDLMAGEQMKPDFVKMNPQHTVPLIDDNGFYLSESRAIMQYLANGYAKNDTLYPKAFKKRALVDQRLNFELSTLNRAFVDAYIPVIFQGQKLETEKLNKFDEALEYLEGFLSKTKFAAADELTLADFSIMADLSTAQAFRHPIDEHRFNLVCAYMERCKREIKGYRENEVGANAFGQFARPILGR